MGGRGAVLAGRGGLSACVAVDDRHGRRSTGETEGIAVFRGKELGGAAERERQEFSVEREMKGFW